MRLGYYEKAGFVAAYVINIIRPAGQAFEKKTIDVCCCETKTVENAACAVSRLRGLSRSVPQGWGDRATSQSLM